MSNDELRMSNDLKNRTKKFAIEVIRFCSNLPKKQECVIIARQLMRCASSVGANYRSVCRAKSKADFIFKLSIVEEEADEAIYWMELLENLGIPMNVELQRLKDEANQLVAIAVSSKRTVRANQKLQTRF